MSHLAVHIRDLPTLSKSMRHFTERLPATNRLLSSLSAMVDVGAHRYVLSYSLGAAMVKER